MGRGCTLAVVVVLEEVDIMHKAETLPVSTVVVLDAE